MPASELFMWMLFAHFVGDYHLQSRWVAGEKHKRIGILFIHAFLCAGPVCMVLKYAGYFDLGWVFYLIICHAWTDYMKCKNWIGDILDQCLHAGSLLYLVGSIYQ